jgi:hypothetical protein
MRENLVMMMMMEIGHREKAEVVWIMMIYMIMDYMMRENLVMMMMALM